MKKKILIGAGIALAVIILAIVLWFIFKPAPMLTQPKENVVGVTITTNPWAKPSPEELAAGASDGSTTITFPGKADMYSTYFLITTCEKRRNIWPSNEGMAFDPAYEIIITYQDGSQDRIFGSENAEDGKIYRCLNPEAPVEQQKFVSALCPNMPKYLNTLK